MTPAAIEHLRCRLFLFAVLPALDDLLKCSAEARGLLGGEAFSVAFKTRTGLRGAYFMSEEGCRFDWGKAVEKADVELFFHSDAQANATFEGRKAIPPMPTRGIGKIGRIKQFQDLSAVLEDFLQPSAEALQSEVFRGDFVKTYFGIILRALCQLCEHERIARDIFKSGPHGLAQFQLGLEGVPTWLNLAPRRLDWGRGEPPREADVSVCFHDPRVALKALYDEMDAQAELGLGTLEIQGYAPLAEQVNLLLERIELYLPKGTTPAGI